MPEPNVLKEMQAAIRDARCCPNWRVAATARQRATAARRTTMQIDHGGQHYALRVTRDNKLDPDQVSPERRPPPSFSLVPAQPASRKPPMKSQ